MIAGFEAGAVIADKGYDGDRLVQTVVETGAKVVIPPERDRKVQRSYDKLLAIVMGFVKLAAIATWVK